jgi:HSP20 family protein
MSDDGRKHLRDVLDELDRFFEDMEKDIQDAVRQGLNSGDQFLGKPFVAGVQMRIGPEGKPSIQFFGDNPQTDGYRAPMHEQFLDDEKGILRLLIELPGVEKEDIDISAVDDKVAIAAERETRKYKTEIALSAAVDPDSGKAEYKNGVLEISFSLKDKTNKGYRRVSVV